MPQSLWRFGGGGFASASFSGHGVPPLLPLALELKAVDTQCLRRPWTEGSNLFIQIPLAFYA